VRINVLSVEGTPAELRAMPGLVRFLARHAVAAPAVRRRPGGAPGRARRPHRGGRAGQGARAGGMRPGGRPGMRAGGRPGMRPGGRPGMRPGMRPGGRAGMRPARGR
jgi:hypothetical protein